MSVGLAVNVTEIHVHRVGPIQISVEVDGGDVSGVEGIRVIRVQLNTVGLRVLAESVQRRVLGQLGGNLEVLVLEHQWAKRVGLVRAGVEEDLTVGFSLHREAKRVGHVAEGQLRPGILRDGNRVFPGPTYGLFGYRRLLSWQEVVRNLPSFFVRVGDVDSESVLCFVPKKKRTNK